MRQCNKPRERHECNNKSRKARCVICRKRIWLAPAGRGTKGSRLRCSDCQGRQRGDPPHDGTTC